MSRRDLTLWLKASGLWFLVFLVWTAMRQGAGWASLSVAIGSAVVMGGVVAWRESRNAQ